MKEQIYTIPVIDAFKEKGECPFCNMHKKLDDEAVDYMLGPSYMEDDIRIETDKIGFCKLHYQKMYNKQNRLGLALMVHTHMQKISKDFEKLSSTLTANEKKSIFSKPKEEKSKLNSYLNNISNSCYICNKIDNTFKRYIDTFFYMWKNMPEIKDFVKSSNGFCLEHFNLITDIGKTKLKAEEYKEFISIVLPMQTENLKRLEEEIEWFINKFDYRYKDEPWKNSQDALPRAITKISSIFVEDENK